MDLSGDSVGQGPVPTWSVYKLPIFLGLLSLLSASVSVVLMVKSSRDAAPIRFSHENEADTISTQSGESANPLVGSGSISVDVEGAIMHPGMIRLGAGSRVEDAIAASGGFKKDADLEYVELKINRAMKLTDGMKIYIPRLGENGTSHIPYSVQRSEGTSYNINPLSRSGSSSQNGLVSINSASQSELDQLPGVGPVTAAKIIDNRPYMSLDELVTKKAIGASLFEKLKNMLSL